MDDHQLEANSMGQHILSQLELVVEKLSRRSQAEEEMD